MYICNNHILVDVGTDATVTGIGRAAAVTVHTLAIDETPSLPVGDGRGFELAPVGGDEDDIESAGVVSYVFLTAVIPGPHSSCCCRQNNCHPHGDTHQTEEIHRVLLGSKRLFYMCFLKNNGVLFTYNMDTVSHAHGSEHVGMYVRMRGHSFEIGRVFNIVLLLLDTSVSVLSLICDSNKRIFLKCPPVLCFIGHNLKVMRYMSLMYKQRFLMTM